MSRKLALFLLAFCLGCGDGTFVLRVDTGTVASDPFCRLDGGRFDLLDRGGLVVLVVIDENTKIFVSSGAPRRCVDLYPGANVRVRGEDEGDRVRAREVELL